MRICASMCPAKKCHNFWRRCPSSLQVNFWWVNQTSKPEKGVSAKSISAQDSDEFICCHFAGGQCHGSLSDRLFRPRRTQLAPDAPRQVPPDASEARRRVRRRRPSHQPGRGQLFGLPGALGIVDEFQHRLRLSFVAVWCGLELLLELWALFLLRISC